VLRGALRGAAVPRRRPGAPLSGADGGRAAAAGEAAEGARVAARGGPARAGGGAESAPPVDGRAAARDHGGAADPSPPLAGGRDRAAARGRGGAGVLAVGRDARRVLAARRPGGAAVGGPP